MYNLDRFDAYETISLLARLVAKEAESYNHIPVRKLLQYRQRKQSVIRDQVVSPGVTDFLRDIVVAPEVKRLGELLTEW